MGANEPVAPASLLQVAGTGRIVREKSLELWQRLWEPKIATLVNVHEHGRTLPLVAVGDNRIGKYYSNGTNFASGPISIAFCSVHRPALYIANAVHPRSGRDVISTIVPPSRIADAVGTIPLIASSFVSTHPRYSGLGKIEG